ncbi:MAG: carboxypeptidase-like regulatory domain-containing protein, partial [Bryobacteraceae bacterium]
MTRSLLVSAVVSACIAFQLAVLPMPALGQDAFGGIGGVTRDFASKQPVAQVRITVHNVNTGTDRTAISGSDGAFTVTKVEPGQYLVAVVKDGFIKSTVDVEVAASETYRVDFLLAAANPSDREMKASPSVVDTQTSAMAEELASLKKRIEQIETALQARTAQAEAAPAPQQAAAPPAPPNHVLPEALEAPDASPSPDNFTPFAFGDFTWLNGTPRNKDTVLDTKFFTPEVRFDSYFAEDFNQPKDHTMGGSTEMFRNGEFQVEQVSFGGDFHWQNVR